VTDTGGYIFDGENILVEIISFLNTKYKLYSAKRVILNGSSSGGKGVAGNCNLIGDMLQVSNSNIELRCIADASGWIPLPVYNTAESRVQRNSVQPGFSDLSNIISNNLNIISKIFLPARKFFRFFF